MHPNEIVLTNENFKELMVLTTTMTDGEKRLAALKEQVKRQEFTPK